MLIKKQFPNLKGFEEINHEQIPKDSPTCSNEVLWTMLALIAQKKWKLNAIDIKTAFLQGGKIDREIYVMPPKEANTTNIQSPDQLEPAWKKWLEKTLDEPKKFLKFKKASE